MKKWYLWLIVALICAVGGVINYFDARSIASSIVLVSIYTFIGFAQLICDKKGETGQKVFRYISTVVLVLTILAVLILLIVLFTRIL